MGDRPLIHLVRHGETEWSRSGRHTSHTDIGLTDVGRVQADALGDRLAGTAFAQVLSSPRRRAVDTCARALPGIVPELTDDLAEWDYGRYEGLTSDEIRETSPGWTIFTGDPPGGETAVEVAARVDRVLARAAAADGDVVCFSHGHLLRVLAARWVGGAPNDGRWFALDTATVSTLGHERQQRVVRTWNT